MWALFGRAWQPAGADSQAAVAEPQAAVFHLDNVAATLEPGEPTEGGLMTRTVWAGLKAPAAERIVIHTFGSKIWTGSNVFDTMLAVYRGTAFSNLTRITGNDNRALTGTGNKHSLVQFNTVAGANYHVQIGSRAQAEGDISLNVFRFPPAGGLSAFLFHYGVHTVNAFNGRDYTCEFFTGQSASCADAKFIVHNSTSQTLTVTPSTTLGPGVVAAPAAFSLAPGALKVVNFTFGAAFNRTTVRTVSGHFIFTGRTGSTIVTIARHRALVVARPSSPITDLVKSVAAGPTVQTGQINEPFTVTSTIINSGAQTAIGCHFRSVLYSYLKTTFYRIDPVTKERLSADNVPLNIPAGQRRTFKVTFASQTPRDADYIDPEVIADCANNYRYLWGLRSGFDITTSGDVDPSIAVTSSTPSNGVLGVPATGFAYYTFRATNRSTTEPLRVLPYYQNPFEDPANTDFTVAICRTNVSTGKCIGAYAGSGTYTPTKDAVFAFSVRVKAPAGAPAFDRDKRRVYVDFKLASSPFILIAAPSIAVRKQ